MGMLGQGPSCFIAGPVAISNTTPVVSTEVFTHASRAISFACVTDGTLDGTYLIEVSNDYSRGFNGQAAGGTWLPAPTGLFTPSLVTVAHGTVATQKQFVQAAPCAARAVRITFTPTAGAGNLTVAVAGGDY